MNKIRRCGNREYLTKVRLGSWERRNSKANIKDRLRLTYRPPLPRDIHWGGATREDFVEIRESRGGVEWKML